MAMDVSRETSIADPFVAAAQSPTEEVLIAAFEEFGQDFVVGKYRNSLQRMFHVKHPLHFSCSIFRMILIVLGKNFTQSVRLRFARRIPSK
jgi:hypothetical protein